MKNEAAERRSPSAIAPVARAPAVAKAVAIVRFLDGCGSLGAPLSDITRGLGITKSHCLYILRALTEAGWVSHDPVRRRYALSPRLLSDIVRLVGRGERPVRVHDELAALSAETRLPCVLTRVDSEGSFIAIDKSEQGAELLVSVPIGHRFPADAPAQMRARLAFSAPDLVETELARWRPVAYTQTTLTDADALRRELELTRERGYAVSRGEYTVGVWSVAVPVMNGSGRVELVLQCPGPQPDVEMRERDIAAALTRTAERIGRSG